MIRVRSFHQDTPLSALDVCTGSNRIAAEEAAMRAETQGNWEDVSIDFNDGSRALRGTELRVWVRRHFPQLVRMRLDIWTHWDGQAWSGVIPSPGECDTTAALEYAFQFFNPVNDADYERIASVGYRLPSLSVGDVVTLNGERWLVAPAGFTLFDGELEPGPHMADRARGLSPRTGRRPGR